MRLNRRKFLQVSAGVATAMALTSRKVGAQLKPVVKVGNPLDTYPDRRWEEVYRDQYKWEQARTAYEISLKYKPNDALTLYWYSLLLRSIGRPAEALEVSARARMGV